MRARAGLVTLYVDGASVGTVTATTNAITSQANVSFGRSMRADNYFNGTLDEVASYNVSLSGATVLAHYNAAGKAGRGHRVSKAVAAVTLALLGGATGAFAYWSAIGTGTGSGTTGTSTNLRPGGTAQAAR